MIVTATDSKLIRQDSRNLNFPASTTTGVDPRNQPSPSNMLQCSFMGARADAARRAASAADDSVLLCLDARLLFLVLSLEKLNVNLGAVDADELATPIGQTGRRQQQEEFLEIEALNGSIDGKYGVSVRYRVEQTVAAPRSVDAHDTDAISAAERHAFRCFVLIRHLSATHHCSDLRRSGANVRHPGRYRPRTARPIETAAFRIGFEDVGQPDHRFGCSQHEEPVRFGRLGEAVENVDLGVLIEVDQNVAAENHIEDPELGKILQQIQLPMLNHGADIGVDLPEFSGLLEVFDEHLDREAALDLELTVDSRPGLLEDLLRSVAMISTRHPASAAPISFRHIASEYGSWPVEPAAHQIRMLLRLARACRTSGMIESRK